MLGRDAQKYGWLLQMPSEQANRIASVSYQRWGLSCGILLLRTWVKGPFSVWRWVGDEGRSSSIMDDSSSALTFNTWIYLYTAAPPQGDFKYTLYTAQWTWCSCRLLCFCTRRMCVIIRACVCFGACKLIKHVCRCWMSEVHCSTLHTSNVTNNFFLQLHCSNPFSGFWNGNIITFLWCGAFDKTASRCAECLTELDVSPKPPLSLFYCSALFTLQHLCPLLSPHTPNLSFWHLQKVILPLSLSHPHRYCSG